MKAQNFDQTIINNKFLDYQNKGFCDAPASFDAKELSGLRCGLEQSFSRHDFPRDLGFFQVEDVGCIQKIVDILSSRWMNSMLDKMSEHYGTIVSILPPFKIKRNYHINRASAPGIGWHRDCGGELEYDFCQQRLILNPSYVFGKVGIYLQENGDFGGAIDVIPGSHAYLRDGRDLMNKATQIPLLSIRKIQAVLPKVYTKMPEKLYMKALRAKKLQPDLTSPMLFDSRILHRGSPIADSVVNKVEFFGTMQAKTPVTHIKYAIYVHFGSSVAVESYLYDRMRRDNCHQEREEWQQEGRLMKQFNPKISNSILSILDSIDLTED